MKNSQEEAHSYKVVDKESVTLPNYELFYRYFSKMLPRFP